MKLLFIGDVMLGRLVNEALKVRPFSFPWGDVLPIMNSADVRICNLECALSDGGSPAHKTFTFRSDAKNVEVLKAAGIDVVTLANNHALDYGPEALADTLGILDSAHILQAGAGRDLAEAQALAKVRVKNATVGLLAATDTNEPEWVAEEDRPGVWFVPVDVHDARARTFFERVKDMRQAVDMLIVSLHWGSNWGYEPETGHREFAHALIDAGADIVFGHSAHICRGTELYEHKPIIYSAGNFIDDYAVNEVERNDESFMFIVEIADGRVEYVRMYPVVIEHFQVRLAGERGGTIAARMEKLCRDLGTEAVWVEEESMLEVYPATIVKKT